MSPALKPMSPAVSVRAPFTVVFWARFTTAFAVALLMVRLLTVAGKPLPEATEDHPSSGLSQTMGILGVILAVVTLATFFVAHGAWWVIPFVQTGLTAVTAWNSALRAQGEISLGAPYRWNSRIQLGYTLGRIVGYLFIAVIAALLIYAIVLMLAGQLKL